MHVGAGVPLPKRALQKRSPTRSTTLKAKTAATSLIISAAGTSSWADHPGVGFGASSSGPITTISASTLPAGTKSIGLEITRTKARPFSNEELAGYARQHIHAHSTDSLTSTSVGLGYGVTDDFSVGLRLGHVARENIRAGHHSHDGGAVRNQAEAHGDSRGLGDLSVLGKYRFLNDSDSNEEASVLAGLKMPTGRTDRRNLQGRRLETEHQPGSGSWDPLIGVAYSKRMGGVSFGASGLYKVATTGAQATDLGDQVLYSAAISYRLISTAGEEAEPHHHHPESGEHTHQGQADKLFSGTYIDLILEVNGEWQGRQTIAGTKDGNSGGNTLYLSPGVRFSTSTNWAANLSLGIPAVQKSNGAHPESDWRLTIGLSRRF